MLTVPSCAVFLQIGGSDQWGNITAGTDLIRKLMGGDSGEEAPQCFGLTFPLLVRGLSACVLLTHKPYGSAGLGDCSHAYTAWFPWPDP